MALRHRASMGGVRTKLSPRSSRRVVNPSSLIAHPRALSLALSLRERVGVRDTFGSPLDFYRPRHLTGRPLRPLLFPAFFGRGGSAVPPKDLPAPAQVGGEVVEHPTRKRENAANA